MLAAKDVESQLLEDRIQRAVNVSSDFNNCFFYSLALYYLGNKLPLPEGIYELNRLVDTKWVAKIKEQFSNLESLDFFHQYVELMYPEDEYSDHLVEKTMVLSIFLRSWFANQLLEDEANRFAVFKDATVDEVENKITFMSLIEDYQSALAQDQFAEVPTQQVESFKALMVENPIYLANQAYFENITGELTEDSALIYWESQGYVSYCNYLNGPVTVSHSEVEPVLRKLNLPFTIYNKSNSMPIAQNKVEGEAIYFEVVLDEMGRHFSLLATDQTAEFLAVYLKQLQVYREARERLQRLSTDEVAEKAAICDNLPSCLLLEATLPVVQTEDAINTALLLLDTSLIEGDVSLVEKNLQAALVTPQKDPFELLHQRVVQMEQAMVNKKLAEGQRQNHRAETKNVELTKETVTVETKREVPVELTKSEEVSVESEGDTSLNFTDTTHKNEVLTEPKYVKTTTDTEPASIVTNTTVYKKPKKYGDGASRNSEDSDSDSSNVTVSSIEEEEHSDTESPFHLSEKKTDGEYKSDQENRSTVFSRNIGDHGQRQDLNTEKKEQIDSDLPRIPVPQEEFTRRSESESATPLTQLSKKEQKRQSELAEQIKNLQNNLLLLELKAREFATKINNPSEDDTPEEVAEHIAKYTRARDAAVDLHTNINDALTTYLNSNKNKEDYDTFQEASRGAIDTFKPELETHRECDKIIANIIAAIALPLYLLAVAGNALFYSKIGSFRCTFWQTDARQKVDAIEDSLAEMTCPAA